MDRPKTRSIEIAKRLWPYFRPYWPLLVIATVCVIIVALSHAAYAYIVQPAVDYIGIKKNQELLLYFPLIIIVIAFTKSVARFSQSYILRTVSQRVIRRIRDELYRHYQLLSLDYYTNSSTGDMISRVTNDTLLLEQAAPALAQLFRQPLTLLGLLAVAFYRDWQLTLISMAALPLTALAIDRIGKRIRKYARRGQKRIGNLASILKENLSGIRIIKAFGTEEFELERFARENQRVYRENIRRALFGEMSAPLIEFLGALAGAVGFYYGFRQVVNGEISLGTLLSFFSAVGLMYEPMKKISRVNVAFQTAFAGAERIFEIMDTVPSVREKPGAIELPPFSQSIKFDGVWFKYHDQWILTDVNFEVRRGEKVAIVGSSGAGKSTLVNLIPRFYDPSRGAILIDGIDIRDVTLKSLRRQIAFVTQDVFLFNDTIANNIAYGDREKDMERVVEAAKAANAHDFIVEQAKGYETSIGELGTRLSGGQKQRIAIARAIYKDAPILILDEATSSLDSESEREVQKALDNLLVGRTAIIIAHRLSTVKNADRILVLAGGRIVEEGRHEELMKLRGEYYKLYQLQFFEAETNP